MHFLFPLFYFIVFLATPIFAGFSSCFGCFISLDMTIMVLKISMKMLMKKPGADSRHNMVGGR